MEQIKLIRQLPELEEHQEWSCEKGCGNIEPKLHRHVYSESWDTLGYKTNEMAEHYYTCQSGHILSVWDEEYSDNILLPDMAYQVRENKYNLTPKYLDGLKKELDAAKEKYANLGEMAKYFSDCTVSFELSFKNGEVLKIDENYLNEIRAQFSENIVFTTHEDA